MKPKFIIVNVFRQGESYRTYLNINLIATFYSMITIMDGEHVIHTRVNFVDGSTADIKELPDVVSARIEGV